MVYSELLFILGVMPATVLVSFFDKSSEYKNLILILTSVAFISWGKPLLCCAVFATVITEYLIARAIGKARESSRPKALLLMLCDLVIDLGVFIVIAHNYLFAADSFLHIRSSLIPIGAGWYATKGFSYCYDVYSGRCKAEKNIFCLLTYMVSYHFVMAGPVARYGELEPYIRKRTVTGKSINDGLTRFVLGLGKGVLLAPAFGRIAAAGLEHRDTTLAGSWIGMLAYFAELWYSFTALCDMAKGLGQMNGFEWEDNYRDLSVGELLNGFLRSANTSLVKLSEDILGGLSGDNVFFKAVLSLVGCVLIALWYSISKPFAAVGVALGALIMIERLLPEKAVNKIPTVLKAVYVLLAATVILGGIRFTTVDSYKNWLLSLFGIGNKYTLSVALKKELLGDLYLIVIAFCNICVPVRKLITGGLNSAEKKSPEAMAVINITKTALTAVILVFCIITLAAQRV